MSAIARGANDGALGNLKATCDLWSVSATVIIKSWGEAAL
jgi:hypothetical protein